MQSVQYQHMNANKYVSIRYMPVTDEEYRQYSRLRNLGYYATTEHDGQDRLLITVASNRGHYPAIERYSSYADSEQLLLDAICSLYAAVVLEGVSK